MESGDKRKVCTIGFPTPDTKIRILDGKGREVKPGEIGEMIVKAPDMFRGYLGQPEKTAEKLKEGWFYTGDIVSRDEDGYIYLEAKKEDIGALPVDKEGRYVLIYKAQEAITGIPEVIEAAIIGVPDPEYQAKCKIIVYPKGGVEISEGKIVEVASKHIPNYLIKDVEFRDKPITKTATGKVSVKELACEYT